MNFTGKTILNCRPDGDSAELTALITAHHGHAVNCPALRRTSLLTKSQGERLLLLLERIGGGAIAAFTSPHGVRLTVAYLQECGALELLTAKEIAVVGDGTKATAESLGLKVALRAADVHGEGLARTIIETYPSANATLSSERPPLRPPVILIRNENAEKAPVQLLSAAGFEVEDFAAYRSEGVEPSRFYETVVRFFDKGGRFDYIILSSAQGVRYYSKILASLTERSPKAVEHLRRVPVIAMAPKTAVAVREHGLVLGATAEMPSNDGIARALEIMMLASKIPNEP